jgi:hypothetical protein
MSSGASGNVDNGMKHSNVLVECGRKNVSHAPRHVENIPPQLVPQPFGRTQALHELHALRKAIEDQVARPSRSCRHGRQSEKYTRQLAMHPPSTEAGRIDPGLVCVKEMGASPRERAEWERTHGKEKPDPAVFRVEILPGLAGVPVAPIARETGLSTVQAWYIRRGERIPHPRFWTALAALGDNPLDE